MRRSSFGAFNLSTVYFLWLLSGGIANADQTTTITQGNSSFVLTQTDTIVGSLPATGEWFVDGRRILVYVSAPANRIDAAHHHPDGHVRNNQLHVAGKVIGTEIVGGIVYTLNGGASGTGVSRLTEFVELTLTPGITTPRTVSVAGFGFKPASHGDTTFEIPDLSGLHVTGTTLAYTSRGSAVVPPFTSDLTTRFLSFVGFNTFSRNMVLNPGSTLRIITELIVSPE